MADVKLFGTDGIRGVANRRLTPELGLKIGQVVAHLMRQEGESPLFVIGRDTRVSGPMLESALVAGITSAGGEVRLLGVASTPAVAYLTRELRASAGVVISASHNPIEDNGLKVFANSGMKVADEIEKRIEELYYCSTFQPPRPEGLAVGRVFPDSEAMQLYAQYLKGTSNSLKGLHLVVDCAHGALCKTASGILEQLGAKVRAIHDQPDGSLINVNCGATDTRDLQEEVARQQADLGLAFDGDADRLIAVDEKGTEVDGDAIMAICAIAMARRNLLKERTLVATVMSNGGLDILAEKHNFKVIRTAVGDRYVLEKMVEGGYNLGGEQSGHIIFSDLATTGDGLLTALQLLKNIVSEERTLSELASELERLPQVLVNQKVETREGWDDNERIRASIERAKGELGQYGRVLVRPSGTEPKIRVMLEAPLAEEKLQLLANEIASTIAEEQAKR